MEEGKNVISENKRTRKVWGIQIWVWVNTNFISRAYVGYIFRKYARTFPPLFFFYLQILSFAFELRTWSIGKLLFFLVVVVVVVVVIACITDVWGKHKTNSERNEEIVCKFEENMEIILRNIFMKSSEGHSTYEVGVSNVASTLFVTKANEWSDGVNLGFLNYYSIIGKGPSTRLCNLLYCRRNTVTWNIERDLTAKNCILGWFFTSLVFIRNECRP